MFLFLSGRITATILLLLEVKTFDVPSNQREIKQMSKFKSCVILSPSSRVMLIIKCFGGLLIRLSYKKWSVPSAFYRNNTKWRTCLKRAKSSTTGKDSIQSNTTMLSSPLPWMLLVQWKHPNLNRLLEHLERQHNNMVPPDNTLKQLFLPFSHLVSAVCLSEPFMEQKLVHHVKATQTWEGEPEYWKKPCFCTTVSCSGHCVLNKTYSSFYVTLVFVYINAIHIPCR